MGVSKRALKWDMIGMWVHLRDLEESWKGLNGSLKAAAEVVLEGLENGGHMLYHHNVFTTTPSPMRVPRSKTTNGTWRSSVCVLFLVISPLQSNKWNLEKRPLHIATQKQLMEPWQAEFSNFASHIAGCFVSHRKSSQFQLVKDKQSSATPRLSSFSQLQWLGKGRKIINRFQDSSSRLIKKTRPSVCQSIDVGLLL